MSAHLQHKRSASGTRPTKSGHGGGSKRSCGGDRNKQKDSASATLKKKVGGYLIGDTIGEGSFAKVRRGTHILTQEKVAIKIIDKKLIEKREYIRKNLRREAVVLQKLRHPNISQLYEVLETSNNYYLVLEFAEGGEFMKYLCEKRKLSERECRKYIRQLLSAVEHMHQADILHRDIKVENFLLDEDMNLKVSDFGLSNVLGSDGLLSTQCGSPAYAAPEIFCNSSYGPAVDVWSIGVNMYAMLTGELPFVVDPPNNMTKLHARILQGSKIPDNLTKDCQNLLSKLLKINDKERITLREIMKHPWVNRGYSHHLKPQSNNAPKISDVIQLDNNILRLLTDCGYQEDEVREVVEANRPLSENASYHLMVKRIRQGWGSPEGDNSNVGNSELCVESIANQSPRSDSPTESVVSFLGSVTVSVSRPKSGRTRLQNNRAANTKPQVSEMNRRIQQARNLKSPVVRDEFETCASVAGRRGSSTLTATISIVKTPSKESIFEDMKRMMERSMVNLDINNNNVPDANNNNVSESSPPRDLVESRLSSYPENSRPKVASIVCDKNGNAGALSTVLIQGTPASAGRRQSIKNNADSPNLVKTSPKRTRLFHKRTEETRRESIGSTTSGNCMVIVNGRLAGEGDANANATSPRVHSRADVPDRIGDALRNDLQQTPLPVAGNHQRYKLQQQRPHTEGSIDTGRSNNSLPGRVIMPSYHAGRAFPQHRLGLYYSTSGRHTKHSRAMTYAPSTTMTAPGRGGRRPSNHGNGGRYRGHRGRTHQRSFTAPSPARFQPGSISAPTTRHLATAPSDYRGLTNRTKSRPSDGTNNNSGLPDIFVSSIKKM